MNNTNLVTKIKTELSNRNMTYKELSTISGVPLDTLNNFFRGKTKHPRIDTVQAIEKALGLSPSTFTEEDYANGVTNKTRLYVDSEDYEWLEIKSDVINKKGIEFYQTLKKIIRTMIE